MINYIKISIYQKMLVFFYDKTLSFILKKCYKYLFLIKEHETIMIEKYINLL